MRVAVLELEDIDRILKKDPKEAVKELLDQVEDYYGEVPYILQFMKDMPDVLIPKVMYDNSIMREIKRLDRKTIELISIGVSAALRCTHCLDMHLRVAERMDIPRDEIFDAILIAGTLSNASVLAYGTRAMDAEKIDKGHQTRNNESDTCDVCNITGEVD
ncbi:MAG: carboxymuconolactone decarboxylase family protein [ANME-2 cluster archaeon]|nr:carboxymuconolactone decarboxylase family protein [ANME-2 cluster archaeon]MDF1530869.1 carboxymuconolactone decarboxylase family protein [ANME-2 cluster archaeon]